MTDRKEIEELSRECGVDFTTAKAYLEARDFLGSKEADALRERLRAMTEDYAALRAEYDEKEIVRVGLRAIINSQGNDLSALRGANERRTKFQAETQARLERANKSWAFAEAAIEKLRTQRAEDCDSIEIREDRIAELEEANDNLNKGRQFHAARSLEAALLLEEILASLSDDDMSLRDDLFVRVQDIVRLGISSELKTAARS